jgi:hypothetical protein
MSDITATVISTTNINASIDVQSIPTVQAVGIQGQSASQTGISGLADVDALFPDNGSVLVYKASTNKWTATTVLDAQDVTGGQY